MALTRVAELIRRAVRDTGVLHALKNDPAQLRKALQLSDAHLNALKSAEAFLPQETALARQAKAPVALGLSDIERDTAAVQAVAPDVLLPPEGEGGDLGIVPVGTPPGARPPLPTQPSPIPRPPSTFIPSVSPKPPQSHFPSLPPRAPATFPSAPISIPSTAPVRIPQVPVPTPSPVAQPAAPGIPPFYIWPQCPQPPAESPVTTPVCPPPICAPLPCPPPQLAPLAPQGVIMGPPQYPVCHCCEATVGIVASVANTAVTAITAITAIAGQKRK
jgi:hypothetical protein